MSLNMRHISLSVSIHLCNVQIVLWDLEAGLKNFVTGRFVNEDSGFRSWNGHEDIQEFSEVPEESELHHGNVGTARKNTELKKEDTIMSERAKSDFNRVDGSSNCEKNVLDL